MAHPDLAPPWHTAALACLIGAVAATGMLLDASRSAPARSPAPRPEVTWWLPSIAVSWGLVVYVSRVGRRRGALRALLGRGWTSARRALGDVACGACAGMAVFVSETAWTRWIGSTPAVVDVLPRTILERVTWVAFAASAGFGEEVVYRGYFQTQIAAWSRCPALGIVAQAALFGVAHLDQGAPAAMRIAMYGLGLGCLARARRSLFPCILAHIGVDLVSGLLPR